LLFFGSASDYTPGPESHVLFDNIYIREKKEFPKEDFLESFQPNRIKINSIPLKVFVSMGTTVQHSPEKNWETVNSLKMTTVAAAQRNVARFNIIWIYEGTTNTFENWNERSLNPYFFHGGNRITLQGPLFPGGKNVGITLGSLSINYSPYIASIGIGHSERANGVSFSNLSLGIVNCSGFFVWLKDSSKSYKQQGEGLRLRANLKSLNSELILVRLREGAPKYTYGIPKFGVPTELSRQITMKYKLNPSVNVEGLWIDKYDYANSIAIKHENAHKLDFGINQHGSKLNISYWNFAENLRPYFRNKRPMFLDNNPKQYVGLNPIDLYKGQQGYNIELLTNIKGYATGLTVKRTRHVSRQEPFNTKVQGTLKKAKNTLEVFLKRDQTGKFEYQEYSLERMLFQDQMKAIIGKFAYIHDLSKFNNDLLTDKRMKELSMTIR
ncbi:MAG: hypothetical protein GX091_01735, partial [Peptococcaceae bacterium]|nr:hypothetical protein [Peptococcaceae bacterium]